MDSGGGSGFGGGGGKDSGGGGGGMDSDGGGSGMDSGGSGGGKFCGCIGVDGIATAAGGGFLFREHCVDVVLRLLFGKTILDNRYTELYAC